MGEGIDLVDTFSAGRLGKRDRLDGPNGRSFPHAGYVKIDPVEEIVAEGAAAFLEAAGATGPFLSRLTTLGRAAQKEAAITHGQGRTLGEGKSPSGGANGPPRAQRVEPNYAGDRTGRHRSLGAGGAVHWP